VKRVQWVAFVLAGTLAGVAGGLFAFSKGSISPEGLHVGKSHRRPGDGAAGRRADPGRPGGGRGQLHLAARHRGAQHRVLARHAGRIMLALVLLFPQGIAGQAQRWMSRLPERWR
jgi:branched-chain amino acid transport system permease protein